MTRPGMTRSHDWDTSENAAEDASKAAKKLRVAVSEFAYSCGVRGFTDAEMIAYFKRSIPDLEPSSYRKRRGELCEDGLIFPTAERRMNDSRRPRPVIVWIHGDFAASRDDVEEYRPFRSKAKQLSDLEAENRRLRARILELESPRLGKTLTTFAQGRLF